MDSVLDVAVIDPPWPQRQGGARRVRPMQTGDFAYSTLALTEIGEILDRDILPMMAHDATVFCWATDKHLREAEQMFLDRRFRLHARIVWDKGNGIAPAFSVRFSHEYMLWLYRGRFSPVDNGVRGKYRDVITAPAREHSRKPDEAYDLVSALYPEARKMDVFSRERREGWLQWGDQPDYFK